MDKLYAMSVFMEISERGSLTAAAEALDKSLPTVVRTLAALEEELSVRLFNRTTRRLSITEEGRVYLEHCRRIRTAVEESEQAMSQTQANPSGMITVTAPVMFGEMHVAPLIVGFLAAYPKVEVKLVLLDRVVDLLEEGMDIAVRIAPLHDSSLVARSIARVRQVICASHGLIAQVGLPETPDGLMQMPCIRSPGSGEVSSWVFKVRNRSQHVPINGRFTCNSVRTGIAACVAGYGFGRFLCYQVTPFVNSGELHTVLKEFEPDPRPLALMYSQNKLKSTRVRSLLGWLENGLRESLMYPIS